MNDAGRIHDAGRIIVGVDGSDSSSSALEWAARQAELTGAVLETVTAWQIPTSYGYPMPIASGYDPEADASKVASQAVERVRETHPGVEIDTTITEGHPAQVLEDASRGAQLLVVGSRGHSQLGGMVMGSVSGHCVARAHCPVVVLRNPPVRAPS